MIKKIRNVFILSIGIIILTVVCIGILIQVEEEVTLFKISDIDMDTSFRVEAEVGRYKIIKWDKDYLEVRGTDLYNFYKKKYGVDSKIEYVNNKLKIESFKNLDDSIYILSTWLPLKQLEMYRGEIIESDIMYNIYVPRDLKLFMGHWEE